MSRILYILICFFTGFYSFSQTVKNQSNSFNTSTVVSFTENKGQICNQDYKPRLDVLYSGTVGELNFHLKRDGISYQLNKIESWQSLDSVLGTKANSQQKVAKKITTYRIDINWLNANKHSSIKKGKANQSYDNYYLQHCPDGILNVRSYEDVTYQNIYNGINLKWYIKDGHLKYDYEVAAGANYKQIQLQINGAKKISLNSKGELIIKTPLGEIVEHAPVVLQGRKLLKAKWLINKNIASYEIENLNPHQSFIIDPIIRTWGTYYGGNAYTYANSSATDTLGNVYIVGHTNSSLANSIATSGGYQITVNGTLDAFLAKFNSLGQRQWGTYYGGDDVDDGAFCRVDKNNDIYISGNTNSNSGTGIESAGGYQALYGGATDVFLAKFNTSGVRIWATYYGGNAVDGGVTFSFDLNNNVYFCGYTKSNTPNVIASPGSHQSLWNGNFDAFLVKFNSSGSRLWSTYYGGLGEDFGTSCIVDSNNDVYLTGYTDSNSGTDIATLGSHQPIFGNPSALGSDGFITKFNSNGVRLWGTYYGGTSRTYIHSCDIDSNDNLLFLGATSSTIGIATFGSHQVTYSGASNPNFGDAFLVKMNSNGIRQWGTYYGGSDDDGGVSCAIDMYDNIYISGSTVSNTGTSIATTGSHQDIYGGGANDGFLAKFNNNGSRLWGTYYGGNLYDDSRSCSVYKNVIYLLGSTLSSNANISTSTSYQPVFTGMASGYLAQFNDCNSSIPPVNNTSSSNTLICANQSTTLSVNGYGNINWYNSSTGGTLIGTGTNYVTPFLSAGTYTYYAEDDICNIIPTRTPITVTVEPSPIVNITSNDSICNGQSTLLSVSGGTNVLWSNGATTPTISVSPPSTTNYSVSVSNGACADTAYTTITVLPIPNANISGNDSICSGQSIVLTASGGNNYNWSSGANTNTVSLNPNSSTNYSVIVSNGNCSDTASFLLKVFPVPVASISGADSICLVQSTILTAGGVGNYTWTNFGTSSNNIVVTPTVNTTYTLIVNNGVCADTAQKTLIVNPLPNALISGTNSICSGQSTTLTASGGTGYSWSNGGANPSISISPVSSTNYSVLVTNSFGCQSSAYTTVSVDPIPYVSISGDTVICANDVLTLTANGVGNFLWNTGENSTSINANPSNNTTYVVIASNSCGNDIDSVSVIVNPLPNVVVSNDTSILINNTISLFASGGDNYAWLPSGLACNTCSVISVSPNTSTVYTVNVSNTYGCSVSKEIKVTVESDFEVFIPDIFSPNGDGQNDVLYVRGLGIKDLNFKIYNRWGEKVFESNDISKGWDGTYKGTPLNNAVFVYDLKANLINGSTINKHGDVTLVK